jgi:hypothetical protein
VRFTFRNVHARPASKPNGRDPCNHGRHFSRGRLRRSRPVFRNSVPARSRLAICPGLFNQTGEGGQADFEQLLLIRCVDFFQALLCRAGWRLVVEQGEHVCKGRPTPSADPFTTVRKWLLVVPVPSCSARLCRMIAVRSFAGFLWSWLIRTAVVIHRAAPSTWSFDRGRLQQVRKTGHMLVNARQSVEDRSERRRDPRSCPRKFGRGRPGYNCSSDC